MLLLFAIFLSCLALPAAAATLVIDGATLMDGGEARVIVEDGRIVAVGDSALPLPGDAVVLDAQGNWLIPGLIDAHVHLGRSGNLYSSPSGLDLTSLRDFATVEMPAHRAALATMLARYLASGVTGVVDRGGPVWTLDLERERGPRIAASGPMLTSYAQDGRQGEDEIGRHVSGPEEARALVRANGAAGVDLIKVHFLPRAGELDAARDWLVAAADEAHALGLPISAHATRLAHARIVIDAGFDQLVHSIDDFPVDEALVERMAARGVVYTTTLLVYEGYREVFLDGLDYSDFELALGDPDVIETLDDLAYLPDRLLPRWLRPHRGRMREPVATPFWATHNVQTVMADTLRRLAAAGVTIAAGTDAGTVGNLHGPALHRELELMVAAGLTPRQALRAATAGGAAAMNRDDIGVIAPGMLADMVLLDADPLADITNTRRIWRVIKAGTVHHPATLLTALN
ncbi:MAG: amidohydrolase family protein [Alphaproteobacteria bacterium]|jgi:imidazolonepropionase-like amidohydrolase|nr:amidohydrolase family protein [Alphaproteobacteria bacterium]